MDFYLQFGHGMMDMTRTFLREWGEGGVILSPRDLDPEQVARFSSQVLELGGSLLFDPQFYLPSSDHERLTSHQYWPEDYESTGFWSGRELRQLLEKVESANLAYGCEDIILPGLFAKQADEDWLARHEDVARQATSHLSTDSQHLLLTVALSSDAVRNVDQVHSILELFEGIDIGGIYLVCEHPSQQYLVEDAMWLANVLELTAGLRLQGKRVIHGYCNQQSLIVACAAATGIASGTWLNVRSFDAEKFQVSEEDNFRRRAKWYYCPQALSEYKVPMLDIAAQQGSLDDMEPPDELANDYSAPLFEGYQPSLSNYSEADSFRHFISCVRLQAANATADSFEGTVSAFLSQLTTAESLLEQLHESSIVGTPRDFYSCIDECRAAIALLRSNRGAMLRRRWATL